MNTRKSSENRKAEILIATLELAFEVGPDHVTTGMIASRLGLTQPAIYKHFPKKEGIWLAVSQALCVRISKNSRKSNQWGENSVDRLRLLILGHLQLVTETPALPEIMVTRDPSGALSEARHRIRSTMTEFRAALTLEFENAITAGLFRAGLRTEDGVTLLLGIIQSLALRLIVTRNPASLVQDGERLLDLQLSLFAGE